MPERNDVNIDKLFQWKTTVDLVIGQEDLGTAYVRLAGDKDVQRARVYALRRSADLRKRLKDPNSDEHIVFMLDEEITERERVVAALLSLKMKEFTRDAYQNVEPPEFPEDPDEDATLEEIEAHQQEVDDYPKKRLEQIKEYVTDKIEKYNEELSERPIEELFKEYRELKIAQLCEDEMIEVYRDYCIFRNVFKDKRMKFRLFDDFEQFEDLRTEIKDQLRNKYLSLELGTEELKK